MKKVYGYIRVSTVKQGTGVSLQEQQEAIVRYAEKHNLEIVQWFEEKETAAKQGRTLFTKMMKLLQTGKANGVIIHKIDRSARNLKDWATIGDLIDKGIEVHFAHESLDMDTRGGRLAADIQAVIASDYIRNLREETKKGIYGRLKQGIYPLNAPIGYINNGRGELKTIDPIKGPVVKQAFHLYATCQYTLDSLRRTMKDFGLTNSSGGVISKSMMGRILNNSFYVGIMKIKGKSFAGNHMPLISARMFADVQNILEGKTNTKKVKNEFVFRRFLQCSECGYRLIGERQKGHVYYRCHTLACTQKPSVKEEIVTNTVLRALDSLSLGEIESNILDELLRNVSTSWNENRKGIEESFRLQEASISQKLDRLTDAYIDQAITKEQFETKKEKLLIEGKNLMQKRESMSDEKTVLIKKVDKFLELTKAFKNTYLLGITEEKREILKIITSNFSFQAKKPVFTMRSPFYEMANRANFSSSCLPQPTHRISNAEIGDSGRSYPATVETEKVREQMKDLLNRILIHFELHVDDDDDLW